MSILSKIGSGLKQIFSKQNLPVIVAIVIMLLIWWDLRQHNNMKELKREMQLRDSIYANNLYALKDTIKTLKEDVKGLVYAKTVFVSSVEDLKKYNTGMYNEVKKLKGDIISYVDSKVKVSIPKMEMDNTLVKYDSSNYGLKFSHNIADSGLTFDISGESKLRLINNRLSAGKTILNPGSMNIGLKYGLRERDGRYEVFAYSPSAMVKFNQLDGAFILDQKTLSKVPLDKSPLDRLNWTVGIGYYYVPAERRFDMGVGIGLTYTLCPWYIFKRDK